MASARDKRLLKGNGRPLSLDQGAKVLRLELAEVHKDKTSGVSIAPVDESKCARAGGLRMI
jgi:hypothetical protein